MEYPETWKYLSFLRLNKFLYATRIEALSESLIQYTVYDVKVRIPEAFMYFMRSLASYLMMGHYIACIWFAASEKAYHVYSYSWLSTTGMLVSGSESSHSSSSSSEHSGAVDLAHISLTRKYFRAMHFAIGSITTLFYADIVSMNLIELFVEMAVILWSIYIYGTLVGAHGEMQEFHSSRKAVFEQNLSELQHYLVLNEVPKGLKKQVKQYYASIWRRRRGEEEFDAIATISRTLQEDVVYATLHRFAWKVSIFHALDVHFLRALLVKLTFVICSESEEVVIRGDVDRSMYFISHGRVLVKQDKYEATKEKGEFFGELALLYGLPRHETCISLTISELYRLDHDPYEELLHDFPEYRVKNKLDWTTAEPAPSVLSSLLHTLAMSGDGAAAKAPGISFAEDDEKSMATTATAAGGGCDGGGIAEEDVPQCHVYRATMEMLAQLDKLDTLEAKEIITRGRAGARTYLKRLAGVETSRGGGGGVSAGEDDEGGSPRVCESANDAVRNFDSTYSPGIVVTSEEEGAGDTLLFTGSATARPSRTADAESVVAPKRKLLFEREFSTSTIN
uniref:Cyclic nucleotide-binding domain-containing protein n=1 Tax=Globisporangium ultimum (strain ATCC 200006 / CBS 805.95 / DAOM BR144) TaxID=431595 RepID=K3WFD1_GLOUD